MEILTSCPLCQGQESELLHRAKDFSSNLNEVFVFSRCLSCGVIFLSTRVEETNIGRYYARDYQPYLGSYNYLVTKFIDYRTRHEIKLFERYNNKIENVLEVGCSYGQYLNNLKNNGHYKTVVGVEMDSESCARANEVFGLEVLNGTLSSVKLETGSCDLAIMNHVLEHLYDPKEALREVSRVLRPKGLFLIKTPNFETIERSIFKRFWLPYEAPRHTVIFSAKILKDLLEKEGFEVEKVIYEKTPNNIILSIKNFLLEKNAHRLIVSFFSINNLFLLCLVSPFSALLGLIGQSGRMVVLAKKMDAESNIVN